MKPKISICCLCYNHEKYLRMALDSFFSQKGEFELEVIIFDDCSTDSSRKIIEEYKVLYPEVLKIIYPVDNVYSQGKTAFYDIINASSGDFLAFCEGDDYWISNLKLEEQLNYLYDNKDLNLVFHPAKKLLNSGELVSKEYGYYGDKSYRHQFTDVLSISGGYMPMASIFARKSSFSSWFEVYPDFFSENTWHSVVQILGAYTNGCGYIPDEMSVYRSMHDGSWSSSISSSACAIEKDYKSFVNRNRVLKQIIGDRYECTFDKVLIDRLVRISKSRILSLRNKYELLRWTPYNLKLNHKIKICVYIILSGVVKYVRK
ncbi:glycosyltransferase [Pseudoalteromonas sp. SIMBA_148]